MVERIRHRNYELEHLVIVLLPAVYFVIFAFFFMKFITPVRRQFADIIRRAEKYDQNEFARFGEALDAVCIGMAVRPPELIVLDLRTPNAAAFTAKGKTYIGITAELLETELNKGEREAIMAHETAHIAAGDALKPPDLRRGLNASLFLVAPVVVLLIGIVPVALDTSGMPLVLGVIPLLGLGYPLSIYFLVREYGITSRRKVSFHSDILADSISAKVTSNPQALESSIRKVAEAMTDAAVVPSQTIGFDSWAVSRFKPNAYLYASNISDEEEDPKQHMYSYIKWQRDLLEERLINLELIEGGRWQMFEGKKRKEIVKPSALQ